MINIIAHYAYGDHWQAAVARDFKVNPRTVRRWAAGQNPPQEVLDDIITLAAAKYAEANVLAAAKSGLWGAGELKWTANEGWPPEVDRAIKARAAAVLRDMGLKVHLA